MEISAGKSESTDCVVFRPCGATAQRSLFCAFFDVNYDSQYRTAETNILWSKIFSVHPERDCSAVSLRLLALMLYHMKATASY